MRLNKFHKKFYQNFIHLRQIFRRRKFPLHASPAKILSVAAKEAERRKSPRPRRRKGEGGVITLPNGGVSTPHLFLFLNGDNEKEK